MNKIIIALLLALSSLPLLATNPQPVFLTPEPTETDPDDGNPDKVYGYLGGKMTDEWQFLKFKVTADAVYDKECQECLLYPVCGGGCPYERIKRHERGENPNDCPLLKQDIEEYLWNHYLFKNSNNKK